MRFLSCTTVGVHRLAAATPLGPKKNGSLRKQLYKETKIRNIALFFKVVDARQLRDPGEQLQKVLEFKKRIEEGKRYLFKAYADVEDFCETLEGHLAKWLRDHTGANSNLTGELAANDVPALPVPGPTSEAVPRAVPDFDYWMAEPEALARVEGPNYSGVLFCAQKALGTAASDIQSARARFSLATAQFHLNRLEEAIAAFTEIANDAG